MKWPDPRKQETPGVMKWLDATNQETPVSSQYCSAKGDGGLAMGFRPFTSGLLILLHTLRSFGTCHLEP